MGLTFFYDVIPYLIDDKYFCYLTDSFLMLITLQALTFVTEYVSGYLKMVVDCF